MKKNIYEVVLVLNKSFFCTRLVNGARPWISSKNITCSSLNTMKLNNGGAILPKYFCIGCGERRKRLPRSLAYCSSVIRMIHGISKSTSTGKTKFCLVLLLSSYYPSWNKRIRFTKWLKQTLNYPIVKRRFFLSFQILCRLLPVHVFGLVHQVFLFNRYWSL